MYCKLPPWLRAALFPEEKRSGWRSPLNKLLRMLYGKNDSGFRWDELLAELLVAGGWERDESISPSVWFRTVDDPSLLPDDGLEEETATVYIDDLLLQSPLDLEATHAELAAVMPLGELSDLDDGNFVGCRYVQTEAGTVCDQGDLVDALLSRFESDYAKFGCTLSVRKTDVPALDPDTFRPSDDTDVTGKFGPVAARHIMGLMYVARHSRPDLSQAIGSLARRIAKWTKEDDRALVRLFAYLRETRDFVLLLRHGADGESGQWALFTDSDFAGDRASRRSTTGYCFGILWESGVFSPVEWCSQVQKAVSLSTAEAELRACVDGLRSFLATAPLLRRLAGVRPGTTTEEEGVVPATHDFAMFVDSEAAILSIRAGTSTKMAYATVTPFGPERKHAQVHLRWLHEQLCGSDLSPLRKIESRENVADIFTKALPVADFVRHRERLGVGHATEAGGTVESTGGSVGQL